MTVRSVKVNDLPELDDEFAQSASEYNTVGELRSNTRKQMEAMRKAGQAGQARDRAIEALLERVDMPLPETVVEHEIEHRHESLDEELERAGLTLDDYLSGRDVSQADLDTEIGDDVRQSVKARFILDQFAEQEELTVEQGELARYVTQLAYQQGVSPDALATQLSNSGQLGAVMSDVIRSKAADLLASRVKVTDESGRKVEIGREDEPEIEDEAEVGAEPEAASDQVAEAAEAAESEPKGRARRGRGRGAARRGR